MKANALAGALLIVLAADARAQAADSSVYAATVAGTVCTQSQVSYQNSAQLNCVYTFGTSLRFSISGVGQADAAIVVEWSEGIMSHFYFKFGLMHGCVIITRGFGFPARPESQAGLDMAFVSPATGRAYKTWQECRTRTAN